MMPITAKSGFDSDPARYWAIGLQQSRRQRRRAMAGQRWAVVGILGWLRKGRCAEIPSDWDVLGDTERRRAGRSACSPSFLIEAAASLPGKRAARTPAGETQTVQ